MTKASRLGEAFGENLPANKKQAGKAIRSSVLSLRCFYRFDHHKLAHGTLIQELDPASDLGEERVVLAATNIQAGLDPRAPLANDNGSAGDYLSAERFETEPLRI
jgi:hypothetical protein